MSESVRKATEEVLTLLEEEFPQEDNQRDQYIENLTDLLNRRDQSIQLISNELTEMESNALRLQDQVLHEKLKLCMTQIKADMKGLAEKKQRRKKYEQGTEMPYQSGVFFDKQSK